MVIEYLRSFTLQFAGAQLVQAELFSVWESKVEETLGATPVSK